MRPIELRSDTMTLPTPAMRVAMAEAEVGDDVWREDPTVRALEERAAEILGKEAALFVPSGTMANQIALLVHCRPGDEVIVGRGAHLRLYESGAGAAWAGVQFAEVGGSDGTFDVAELEAAILPIDPNLPRTRLVAVENTHNRGGGKVWPTDQLDRVAAFAVQRSLALHLDGARIWNATVVSGRREIDLAKPFDTVSACFSKGLGAPVGSVFAGTRAHVDAAIRFRKMLGGGMRQAGIVAAGALYALEHHRGRLALDHQNARALAQGLASIDGIRIDPAKVETNIVIAEVVSMTAPELVRRLAEKNVRLASVGPNHVRAVTHLGVDRDAVDRAIEAIREVTKSA